MGDQARPSQSELHEQWLGMWQRKAERERERVEGAPSEVYIW